MRIRRALLSVSDKRGLIEFAQGLQQAGVQLIASGGTARVLREAGLSVQPVSELTGAPEILGGRVKTLHPAVHGGILSRRSPDDRHQLADVGWDEIDLVAVNLYPFEETIARPRVTLAEAIEQIDIGGIALLRAAAKNYHHVAVVCDPADYAVVLSEISQTGAVDIETRRLLAIKAFARTSAYDAAIWGYLAQDELLPEQLALGLHKVTELRYGENPHQRAALYADHASAGPVGGRLLQGKELSYNNLLDLDAAWWAAMSFERPTVVIVKHLSPCGVASADTLALAFPKALSADPVSAFGSVIGANRVFDGAAARALGELFVEAIAAPRFDEEARGVLLERPNCRLVAIPPGATAGAELRAIHGGYLVQERDRGDDAKWRLVTRRAASQAEMKALQFAWHAVAHVKSNAILLARNQHAVGIGGGQPSRLDAVRQALAKAGKRARGSVLASDAFFPFADGVEEAAAAGVTAVVQPGGSVRDEEVIEAANRLGVAMYLTGARHFRH